MVPRSVRDVRLWSAQNFFFFSLVAGDALLLLWGVVGLLEVGGLRGDVWGVTRERMASDFGSISARRESCKVLYSSMVSDRLNK